jgi:tRNA (Thr-GGU) A37 N-methylase
VGDGTAVEDGVSVHARPDDTTRFGNRVTLGHGAMIHNATVHDEAVVGMRATVSDFAVVGAGAIVGEMGLVKQHQKIPPRKIAVGVPAQVVGDVSEKNRDMTVWAKDLYIDLAHRYPSGLKEIPADDDIGAFTFHPVGVIRTPFTDPDETPRPGVLTPDAKGAVELEPAFAEGRADLEGCSHVTLLFVFDRARGDDRRARLSPKRPDRIGLTVVKLERMEGNRLHVSGVDVPDGTPLLDIKPGAPGLIR